MCNTSDNPDRKRCEAQAGSLALGGPPNFQPGSQQHEQLCDRVARLTPNEPPWLSLAGSGSWPLIDDITARNFSLLSDISSIENRLSGNKSRTYDHIGSIRFLTSWTELNSQAAERTCGAAEEKMEETMGRGILLWLLGVPIPIIILLALIWH
jgi:hypothetical protein